MLVIFQESPCEKGFTEGQFLAIRGSQSSEGGGATDFSQKKSNVVTVTLPRTDAVDAASCRSLPDCMWTFDHLSSLAAGLLLAQLVPRVVLGHLVVFEHLGKIVMTAEVEEGSQCSGWRWSLCPLDGIVHIEGDSLAILEVDG